MRLKDVMWSATDVTHFKSSQYIKDKLIHTWGCH